MISFCPFNSQIRKSEKQKTYDERNGESDRRGDRSSSFIVNKVRISEQMQLQFNSLRKGVVCLEAWIWQVMVWAIITWETSTMVPLSCAPQDRIYHIHVWLDIWRCRPTRINVRLNTPHRKAMNSNDNQVCRVFSRTQWECICSSVMKLADLILLQSSHSPLTIDTETLDLSITGEKYTVVSRQHMVTCSCSPSLPLCSVVRCFQGLCPVFFEKTGTQSKEYENFCESLGIESSWAFNFVKYHKNNREKPRPRPAYSFISFAFSSHFLDL